MRLKNIRETLSVHKVLDKELRFDAQIEAFTKFLN